MSHTLEPHADATVDVSLRRSSSRTLGLRGVGLAFLGVLLMLSFIRILTGADDLTSAGTVAAAIGLSVPIAMAGLGGLWSERAGVVNIGLEGMLILGTFGAGWAGYQWGPWAGLFFGVTFGALGGLLHAVATVTFAVDQIVSGVAINILALGLTRYLASVLFDGVVGAGPTQSAAMTQPGTITVPGLVVVLPRPRGQRLVPRLGPRRDPGGAHRRDCPTSPSSRSSSSWRPTSCSGVRPSACGCGPAARRRTRPRRWASG